MFLNHPANSDVHTLSLHDALPILRAITARTSSGRASALPVRRTQYPASTILSTVVVMMPYSAPSSSAGRLTLSVDSIHTVTSGMSRSTHQDRNSTILAAPIRWPSAVVAPAALAQRP